MAKSDSKKRLSLKELFYLFPKAKESIDTSFLGFIDDRLEDTFSLIRKKLTTPVSTFGSSDSVTAMVLRRDPATESPIPTMPHDDAIVAKVMILNDFHTSLLPFPNSLDEIDLDSQIIINSYPTFRVTNPLIQSGVVAGAIVEGIFDAGSLSSGEITGLADMDVQNMLDTDSQAVYGRLADNFTTSEQLDDFNKFIDDNKPPKFTQVMVDYGHGGVIDGVYMGDGKGGKQYKFTDHADYECWEGEYNREVAYRLMNLLLNAGVEVYDVVARKRIYSPVNSLDLEQTNVSLSRRCNYANSKATDAVFISLHGNAADNKDVRAAGETETVGPSMSARGIAFYTTPGEDTSDIVSAGLIRAFRNSQLPGTGMRMRHKKPTAGQRYSHDMEAMFYVLKTTKMPSILGEVGFFTNYTDAQLMNSPGMQSVIAQAYFTGLLPFLEFTNTELLAAAVHSTVATFGPGT
tara:strand:- start:665 stop:2047 length:1383 start_codon:yes stop_codon:yes gene_type:complete